MIIGGRYGLGSKDTIPADIIAIPETSMLTSLLRASPLQLRTMLQTCHCRVRKTPHTSAEGNTACKFWGLGSDGTVGANKNSIKIIGDHTDLYAQAYFAYDSKKSGGITVSHLRFGKKPIKSTYLINKANFVACHNRHMLTNMIWLRIWFPGGKFLLNCAWDIDELSERLPGKMKKYIARTTFLFTQLMLSALQEKSVWGNKTSIVLQSAFFKIANVIPL